MDHKELNVWKESICLVELAYQYVSKFPQSELFGLSNQMRRCAVSIPSNIAEGEGRNSDTDRLRFLGIARGSLAELETQVIIAQRLRLTEDSSQDLLDQIIIVQKLLNGFITYLHNKNNNE